MSGEGIKEVIFDIPSTVPCLPELTREVERERKRGGPPPVMIFNVFEPFFGDASSLVIVSWAWSTRKRALTPSAELKPSSSQNSVNRRGSSQRPGFIWGK